MIPRRSPGQRRRRSRREEELAQLEAADPERARELTELRRYNPQAYRKELRRLVRDGVIRKGRGFEVPDDALGLLRTEAGPDDEVRAVLRALAAAQEGLGFRTLAGLREAEAAGSARREVLEWLDARHAERLDADNRTDARVTQRQR